MRRGDAVFHDRWTIHATAPNETRSKRRGWALHYADARSTWGDHGIVGRDGSNIVDHNDSRARARCRARNEERIASSREGRSTYTQWRGRNFIDGRLNGNRDDVLVCGHSHAGCI